MFCQGFAEFDKDSSGFRIFQIFVYCGLGRCGPPQVLAPIYSFWWHPSFEQMTWANVAGRKCTWHFKRLLAKTVGNVSQTVVCLPCHVSEDIVLIKVT